MKTFHIKIDGMSCGHCVMAVKKEFSKILDLKISSVEIGKAEVSADEATVSEQQLKDAVKEAGYTVVSIQ
jgi:copper chaperone